MIISFLKNCIVSIFCFQNSMKKLANKSLPRLIFLIKRDKKIHFFSSKEFLITECYLLTTTNVCFITICAQLILAANKKLLVTLPESK